MSSQLAKKFQNKLIRNNYVEWKLNLDELLNANGCKYVLTIPYPPTLSCDTLIDFVDQYNIEPREDVWGTEPSCKA